MNVVAGPNPLEMILLIFLGGGFGMSPGVPPTEEAALAAKVAPAECLFYASWAGTGTPDANSKNQTEQLLAEEEIQEFLTQSRGGMLDFARHAAANQPDTQENLEDVGKLLKLIQGKPGTLFLTDLSFEGNGPPNVKGAGLLRLGDDAAEAKKLLEGLQARAPEAKVSAVTIGSREYARVQLPDNAPSITWGLAGKYLVVGLGDGSLEGLIERARGEAPDWLTDIRAKLPVPRVSSVAYVNVDRAIELAVQQSGSPEAERIVGLLGLDKIKRFASVTGLDETGCLSRMAVTIDGTPDGWLSWIDAKPFAADDLKPIPYDAIAAVAFKLDADWLLDRWLETAEEIDPRQAAMVKQGMAQLGGPLGIDPREDFLKSLGDSWRIFVQPGPNAMIDGWTFAVQVRDREKLERVQKAMLQVVKRSLEQGGPGNPSFATKTVDGRDIHTLDFRQLRQPFAPSWCLTDDELLIAATPEKLKALLSKKGERSLAEHADVAPLVADDTKTLAFAYLDTRQIAETILPKVLLFAQVFGPRMPAMDTTNLPSSGAFLPHLQPSVFSMSRTAEGVALTGHQTLPGGNLGASVPVVTALALPAVAAAREAARRAAGMNQLKQIALAMHNFHDARKAFPAGYSADEDGKPLLSWRVHILPFIEQADLYREFHLDEPWDSPHNKKLIERMPTLYRAPGSKSKPGMTNYLGVAGADGIFVRPQPGKNVGTSMRDITDGTSDTIMTIEVPDKSAVIWTRPGDFTPDKEDPTKGLVGLHPNVFSVGLTDGSVRSVSKDIDAALLHALFTKAGGEAVNQFHTQ